MNANELGEVIERYLRVQTFPLGFRFVKSKEEVPEKARVIPDIAICQAYNLARKYGWTVYFDINTTCPLGIVAYGFAEPDELYNSGKLAYDAGYAETMDVAPAFEDAVPKLAERFEGCVVAPLNRCSEVDFVVVYGNPAQILRLVHAVLHDKGGAFETKILGRGACAEFLEAYIEKKPRLVIPCYGDRLFGLTQDDEIAFSFPYEMGQKIAENLEKTHRRGIRYPIPNTALRLRLPMIKSYEESVSNMKGKR
ncbi:Uncharacterized protein conserved in archaea [Archaeoglobus sulfaticallidus PM70-1]|uniref:Uncharacterized protein conserved in archaea n=1 Tax=Archaeoglobus sulfaticallidus PM70-1 TaxID=387631 RepID=N0BDI7_9EURY|nr:DUF169 domain-containing protein [Archaeoglobus sulfaticallidus]AGK60317.1 Uncharacterized protein conserved in archaea [Archaeoglobus sulfaticallidus PM70-1]